MSMVEAAHHIYLQMRTAKRTWRRFTGRPVRRFRRFFKASKGRGKGKIKGKRSPGQAFMYTQDEVNAFLSGKGKGGRSHSSGKGFGRKKNPKDRNGQLMTCHNCGSDEHLVARCPQKGQGKGVPPSMVNFLFHQRCGSEWKWKLFGRYFRETDFATMAT